MTDVADRPTTSAANTSEALAYSLQRAFELNPRRLELLTAAISAGKVHLPTTPLQLLPIGVAANTIATYRRDVATYGPDGMLRLKAQMILAEEVEDGKTAAELRAAIDKGPQKFEAAEADLAWATELRARRESMLARWLNGCGLTPPAIGTLVQSLRSNVTYVCFIDGQGTLYVETN